MSPEQETPAELERYELAEAPPYHFDFGRRGFFKMLGGGILVVSVLREALAQESGGGGRRGSNSRGPQEIGAWLHIDASGKITVFTGKVEVGQNIRTSLTQVVADELHAPVGSIQLVMGDTDLTPFDAGTFGSQTTPAMASRLRKVGAAARDVLVGLAAEAWKCERASLTVEDGKVVQVGTSKSIDFGHLTEGKKLVQTISASVEVTAADKWTIAGHAVPRVDGRAFVTGQHKYPSDIKIAGMLYGKVLRPTAFGAHLVSLDSHAAEALPGITVLRDADFAGVTAPGAEQATVAIAALRAEWKGDPQPSGKDLFELLKRGTTEGRGGRGSAPQKVGSIEDGMAAADQKLEANYTIAYIAHAPLEPRAAVAQWTDGKLTVWTGTQRPFGVRSDLANVFRIPESDIRVIMPDMGSGYGGKHTGEAAVEAARLAKAAGKPVKVVWTREEEFTWAYFRPAGVIEVKAGARNDGRITAWEFHNYNSGGSAIRTLYDIPNQHIEFHPSQSPLRQGSYRGLAATANHFAREMEMDALARLVKMDPVEFRLKNLKEPRLRAVIEAVAERFGWGKAKPAAGQGFGIAAGFEKGAYVATCAQLKVNPSDGTVKTERVVAAFECGAVVSPDNLKNQIEGSIVMGIGGALFEAIEFDEGRILNPRFSRYRVPRFSDAPVIETVLLDRKDLASTGAGETPIVAIAPAIGNAIFDATGVRRRSLPMAPHGWKV